MDSIITSGHDESDVLLAGLNYKGDPTASFVLSTRQARWSAESGNRFDGVGSRQIRFRIGDPTYLEPGSLRLSFVIHNNQGPPVGDGNAQAITPVAPVQSMFSRYRVFLGSTLVEEVDNVVLAPTHALDSLKPPDRRVTDSVMNFVMKGASAAGFGDEYTRIEGASSRRVTMSLPLGICSQSRWLPLMLTGALVIELELADGNAALNTANWSVSGPYLFGSVHDVDAALQSEYSRHVLEGGQLQLSVKTMSCTRHVATADSFSVNISRAYTRLCQVFAIPRKANADVPFKGHNPIDGRTPSLTFDTLKAQLVIGSRRFPDTKIESLGEAWVRLQEAAGTFWGTAALGISPSAYKDDRFILGWNLEKVAHQDAALSGFNTHNGSLVSLELEGTGLAAGDAVIVICIYDEILSIKDGVVDVFM